MRILHAYTHGRHISSIRTRGTIEGYTDGN